MNLLMQIDELRTTLEELIGCKYANEIYNEIKAESNLYGIVREIERLNSFVQLAAAGCNPPHMIIAAREQSENLYLSMLGVRV